MASIKEIEQKFIDSIKSEVTLNNGDELPFGYYNPASNAKVTWMCGEDQDGKITSVFCFENDETNQKEKNSTYITKEKALEIRTELINDNWQKIIPPKAQFKFASEKDARPLKRKEVRWLSRKLQQSNPFLKK